MKHIEKIITNKQEKYAYIKSLARYYSRKFDRFFSWPEVQSNLMISHEDLKIYRSDGTIQSYDGTCYLKGWKEHYYNLMDENCILSPSDNPEIDPHIKYLIESVAGYKENNIHYLHKLILYKYLNINNVNVPALIMYWVWGSGKSSLLTLMETIYWKSNVLKNVGQKELTSDFDFFKWDKIIIWLEEITSHNTNTDKRITNKLKNWIFSDTITLNIKGVQSFQVNNIAQFFIGSNSNIPIQFDDKDKWNRRFSVIKSQKPLENGQVVNDVIRDTEKVSDYLAWLLKNYDEVKTYTYFDALDNQDKKDLEDAGQHEVNSFWEWLKMNYPDFKGKIRVIEIAWKIDEYCLQADIHDQYNFKKFFWKNSPYPRRNIWFKNEETGESKQYSWVNIK